jgi:acetolactate synthase-1/3 small subunit
VSRITLQTRGDETVLEQITKQLHKLVTVIEVVEMAEADHVERELCLVKVTADKATRSDVLNVVNIFRAKVVDVGETECIVEIIGDDAKINALVSLLEPIGIKEIARTGKAALFRGSRLLTADPPKSKKTGKKSKEKAA